MIFITTGTTSFQFDRLINFCIDHWSNQIQEKIIIQGFSKKIKNIPSHIKLVSELPFSNIQKYYREADLIIAAAGEATILELLKLENKKIILFPRDPFYKEHVDDQQLQLAKVVENNGWFKVAYNVTQLKALL